MMELLYKYYFKLLSIHPIGALDLKMRRFLGVLFNQASTASDLATIRQLAKNRQKALVQEPNKSVLTADHLPCIDIIIIAEAPSSTWQSAIEALSKLSYPTEKLTLSVIFFTQHSTIERLSLPDHFLQTRYFENEKASGSSAFTAILKNLTAPYFMLISAPLILKPDSLNTIIKACISDSQRTSLWEVSPSLSNRRLYYDPVTLEIPCSVLDCGVINRECFDTVGGFDERFPIFGQGFELGYRMRAYGYTLKNIGQTGLFTQLEKTENETGLAVPQERKRTLNLMRLKYGNRFQRVIATLSLLGVKGKETSRHRAHAEVLGGNEKPRLNDNAGQLPRLREFAPSRLWRHGYEISMGDSTVGDCEGFTDYPKVSIIVRTYAGRGYWLRESICSVLNQTYPNIELVIVEDGSAEHEGFLDLVRGSLKQGQSLKYLTQKKMGKSNAGNLGLANAEGRYIGFLDDDDLLFANHVELLLWLSLQDKETVGAYSSAWEVQTSKGVDRVYNEEHFEAPRFTRQPYSRAVLEKQNIWAIQSVLFKRELYEQYGGFETDRVYLEDWEFWLRYTREYSFAYLPQITSMYRTPADPYLRLSRVSSSQRRAVKNTT